MKLTIKEHKLNILISQETTSDALLQDLYVSKKSRYLLYQHGQIFKNQEICRHACPLHKGDILTIQRDIENDPIPSYAHPVRVLYEDELLLIIDKEPNMLVHSDGINTDHTVSNCVQHYYESTNQDCPVRPLHRLDVETSGILLFCKFPLLQPLLDHMMETKQIRRHYLAVVQGHFPKTRQIYTDPIGRDRHDARRYITHPKGKSACTKATLVTYDQIHDRSLIRCMLETGRTHQIRVHLSAHGYPLVNDPLYGTKTKKQGRLALHSAQVSFYHPLKEQTITLSCPLPEDLGLLLSKNEEK